jgi:hypothetical protein
LPEKAASTRRAEAKAGWYLYKATFTNYLEKQEYHSQGKNFWLENLKKSDSIWI